MAKFNIKLENYVVDLGSGSLEFPGFSAVRWNARIRAYGEGYELTIVFAKATEDYPLSYFNKESKHIYQAFDTARFSWCVDLLRNEGPVFVFVDTEQPSDVLFTTGFEPVGEGEGSTE